MQRSCISAVRQVFDSGEGVRNPRRKTSTDTASTPAGIQIQRSSLSSTAKPFTPKKRVSDIGETKIGRHGKKYRALSNGEKNATPRPPLVIVSKRPWLAVAKKKYVHSPALPKPGNPRENPATRTSVARIAAKRSECVKPAMPPEIAVTNTQTKSHDINVRQHCAHHADNPNALQNWRTGEDRTDSKGRHCM